MPAVKREVMLTRQRTLIITLTFSQCGTSISFQPHNNDPRRNQSPTAVDFKFNDMQGISLVLDEVKFYRRYI